MTPHTLHNHHNSPTDQEALDFHAKPQPGKISLRPTKSLTTANDLSLAYSPGVAVPCREIARDPQKVYDYTSKGNMIAVISNGTAILGLGNLGALASKPVMEGKAVLFKRFADVDAFDLEINTEDPEAFINCVRYLGPSFGGINLEDISAPSCFVIEKRLQELLDIPVFHDDQHGTAIIAAAALLNAFSLTQREWATTRIVINGAGAAGLACADLLLALGIKKKNLILCDRKGVIYRGREKINPWQAPYAAETSCRTLTQAASGADVLFGLSAAGAFTPEMIQSMAARPIVFAMANPTPEIMPEAVYEVVPDAIVATGRSDYPNQVNNVLGFPYIFRGALDVNASAITQEMKLAAAKALAELARQDVPDEVDSAYAGRRLRYGSDYIIPAPFDPRLISHIPPAVAEAAERSGVARRKIARSSYPNLLAARLDPTAAHLQGIFARISQAPQRIVFAEGEEERVIRAAYAFQRFGYGIPILVGREELIQAAARNLGIPEDFAEITNARLSQYNGSYIEFLYKRFQRGGLLKRDCQRMVNQNRNIFAGCMLELGQADAMITGLTRGFYVCFEDISRVIDPKEQHLPCGMMIVIAAGRTVFIADTSVNPLPNAAQLADIAEQTAHQAQAMGHEPRVAFLSYSNFGNPLHERAERIRQAVSALRARGADFEFDGEMQVNVALNAELMKELYPFCTLSGPANVLIMPALHSANIAAKLLQQIGGGSVIGPVLLGMNKPVQILPLGSTVNDIVTTAAICCHQALDSGV